MKKWPRLAWAVLFFAAMPAHAMPAIVEVTGKSGVKAWLVEDHKLPLVTMKFSFRGGVETDPVDKQGLATLATSLMTLGAGPYDEQAFQERLADHSIQLDISAGRDEVQGYLKTLSREKSEAFRLLALSLTQPRFDQESFDRTKARQMTALTMQMSKPDWQGRVALYRTLWGAHPYTFRSLGSRATVGAITRDDAVSFAKSRLARDTLQIAVVGAITQKELADTLDQVFGSLPEKAKAADIGHVPWIDGSKTTLVARKGAQTNIQFAIPSLKRDDPDWYASQIANYILGGGGFISRLMKQVRAQEGLTYGVGTGISAMKKASVLVGTMATDNSKASEAWTLLLKVWQEFYDKGVTSGEVDAARDYLTGSLPLAMTSRDEIAATLLDIQTENLGIDYLQKRNAMYEAVTTEDVNRVIRKWFNPQGVKASFVGMPENMVFDQTQDMITE